MQKKEEKKKNNWSLSQTGVQQESETIRLTKYQIWQKLISSLATVLLEHSNILEQNRQNVKQLLFPFTALKMWF